MGSAFLERLGQAQAGRDVSDRRWVYVPYDQLTSKFGPLAEAPPRDFGVVMVESATKARRRPYHRQKLALVLANQRHFALELAERGFAVRYAVGDDDYATQLDAVARELGTLRMMEAAEHELRTELAPLVDDGAIEVVEHEGWLSTEGDFDAAGSREGPWRMDAFYRAVRRRTGVLMANGKPIGGKFSFDKENRDRWKGDPPPPELPTFEPDDITREVGELVRQRFADHPGCLDLERLPAQESDARLLWTWFLDEALPHFGPFQDAMSRRSSGLFHSRISALLNLHRLSPREVVDDVVAASEDRVTLASREGFVRQVIGWREFVRHVHRATDGLRRVPQRNHFDHRARLPAAYWGEVSGLACLDHVVEQVWDEGYGHHITRLMVLSNLATLLGVQPQEVSDWFWIAYADAYDWVVEPNVLGMGVHALGDLMTTKPYVCGGAYISRMGDYCEACEFHPRRDCPITSMYWAFLARQRGRLESLGRMQRPLWSLDRRDEAKQKHDAAVFDVCRSRLGEGRRLRPADLPESEA